MSSGCGVALVSRTHSTLRHRDSIIQLSRPSTSIDQAHNETVLYTTRSLARQNKQMSAALNAGVTSYLERCSSVSTMTERGKGLTPLTWFPIVMYTNGIRAQSLLWSTLGKAIHGRLNLTSAKKKGVFWETRGWLMLGHGSLLRSQRARSGQSSWEKQGRLLEKIGDTHLE